MSIENLTVVVSPTVCTDCTWTPGSTPELSAPPPPNSAAVGTTASACTADTTSVASARSKPTNSPCASV
ncbi:MAG: hypothetical protein BWX68_03029 [Verrucomicrobia bacterium ADurb.Bin063]|nr:MAG: hypothetical protein BWX68_03029 [Verrucomicrobia bacterium ADurb.Bin063]